MSGSIAVYEEPCSGILGFGSRDVMAVFQFLIWCKSASSILAADPDFDPLSDFEGLGGVLKHISLAHLSDETVAEIGSLMREGADPRHPFWAEDSRLFDLDHVEKKRKAGIDMDAELAQIKKHYQSVLSDVSRLIDERLGRTSEGEGTDGKSS